MKIYILLDVLLRIIYNLADELIVDYCKSPCHINNKTVEHIVCTLKNDCSVGPECKVKTKFDYTHNLQSFTLDMHNYFRNKVALGEASGQERGNLPKAADMLEMVWDEELAYFAQCYANKCILQYDKCRQTSAGENIGQLIFIRVSVNPKTEKEIITEMLEYVYLSSKAMPLDIIEKYKDNKYTKQFTQLVWASTNRVGCGITKLLEDLDAFFMVCNYGPAGNIEGKKVYNVGLTCSNCPHEQKCANKFSGLCAATEDERKVSKGRTEVLGALEQMFNIDNEDPRESNETYMKQTVTESESTLEDGDKKDIFKITTTSISTRSEMATSKMVTLGTSYEHLRTDQDSQQKDFSTKENGSIDLFGKLVSEEAVEKTSITDEEVPMRNCMVKRPYNWPDLRNQDSAAQNERRLLCFMSMYIIFVNIV